MRFEMPLGSHRLAQVFIEFSQANTPHVVKKKKSQDQMLQISVKRMNTNS